MSSKIERIVDFTARIAGGIDGIKSVSASGQGYYDDPLRPGQKIAVAGVEPKEPYSHMSDIPAAPMVKYVNQSGGVELTWHVPMRLWLPKTDDDARRTGLPFYDRYLRAFLLNYYLNDGTENLALRTELTGFRPGGDKDWSWLDIQLTVVERVEYAS